MAGVSNINLFAPDYAVQSMALDRQRKLAELMQQQSLQPLESPPASGGWAVPMSPLAPLAKMLQGYAGSKGMAQADERQLALAKALQGRYSSLFGAQSAEPASSTAVQSALSGPQTTTDTLGEQQPNVGPTNTNAAALAEQLRADPASGTTRTGPLQFDNQDPNTSMLRYMLSPDKYMEALFKSLTPSDTVKRMRELGISATSPEGRRIMAQGLQKDVHVPPLNLRPGGVALDPMTNQPILSNPVAPAGTMNQWQPGSPYPSSNALIPGAQENAARGAGFAEAGKAYGHNLYGPPTAYPTGPEPTAYTPMQAIHQATGAVPPAPWQNPALTGAAQPAQEQPPQQQAPQQRVDLAAQNNPAALGMANQLNAQNVPFRVGVGGMPGAPTAPRFGMPLQDQGAGAEQRKQGERLGEYFGTVQNEAAMAAVSNRYLQNMESAAREFNVGKLAPMQSWLTQWGQALGAPIPDEAKTAAGSIQALTSMAIKMAGTVTRQSDAQPSQLQYFKILEAMPNEQRTPEGFARIVAYMKDMNNYNIFKMEQLHQWQQSHQGSSAGFESAWPGISSQLPLIWNQQFGGAGAPPPANPVSPRQPTGLTPQEQQELRQLRQRFGRG